MTPIQGQYPAPPGAPPPAGYPAPPPRPAQAGMFAAPGQVMVQAAQRLVEAHADVGAILLECTNMVPYAPDIAAATGRPVHSIHSYLNWFHAGLQPPRFA